MLRRLAQKGSGGGSGAGAELWNSLLGYTPTPDVQPPAGGSGAEHLANAFTIPKGSGGEALMGRLGVDKSNWYRIQDEILDKFPKTFYRRETGDAGISTSGKLPRDVQEFISSKLSGDKLPRSGV